MPPTHNNKARRLHAENDNSFTLAQALAGAIAARAHVIDLSLVGPADPLLTSLIEKVLVARMVIVGAAGGEVTPRTFPGPK